MVTFDCYHCEEIGHWIKDCPWLTPPDDKADHERRFNLVMKKFHEGTIALHVKRRIIEKENAIWNKRKKEMASK